MIGEIKMNDKMTKFEEIKKIVLDFQKRAESNKSWQSFRHSCKRSTSFIHCFRLRFSACSRSFCARSCVFIRSAISFLSFSFKVAETPNTTATSCSAVQLSHFLTWLQSRTQSPPIPRPKS